MIPLDHRDRGNRADPYTETNSCFSDSSNSLNSLNSMKVPPHLEKTPMQSMLQGKFSFEENDHDACLFLCFKKNLIK